MRIKHTHQLFIFLWFLRFLALCIVVILSVFHGNFRTISMSVLSVKYLSAHFFEHCRIAYTSVQKMDVYWPRGYPYMVDLYPRRILHLLSHMQISTCMCTKYLARACSWNDCSSSVPHCLLYCTLMFYQKCTFVTYVRSPSFMFWPIPCSSMNSPAWIKPSSLFHSYMIQVMEI